MARFVSLTAAILASLAPATLPPVHAAPADGVVLAPHLAFYDLKLARTNGNRGISGVHGRILYDFSGSACEGYELKFRQVSELDSVETNNALSDLTSTTWEDGEAKRFRFNSENKINQQSTDVVVGRAERGRNRVVVARHHERRARPRRFELVALLVELQHELTADVPLRVLLHLRTTSYEIRGGPVRELVLEPGRAEVLTFDVRALRPGRTDGIELLVTDADGTVVLAESTVVVRSTTFSVAGLVVTVGAALFLLAWGVREAARRRRAPLQAAGARADRPHEPTARPTRAR